MRDGRARIPSLPGMPGHLQSTIAARVGRDTRPMTSADVIVMDQRKTGFLQGRRIGIVSAVLNMTNAIIGSGVLGLPYIASTSGIGLFAILLVITACVIDYSLQLLIAAACVTHQPGQRFSYELLGEQAFGMNGRLLVSLMIVMQNTANMTSYIVVFKDVIADIMGLFTDNTLLTDERFMTIMMCALVVLPLSSSSRLGPLAYVGVLQIVMVMGFVFYVMAMAIDKGDSFRTEPHTYPDGSVHDGSDDPGSNKSLAFFSPSRDTFLAMPTFCFSFICHTALLPIYDELQEADDLGRTRRPRKRIAVVVHMAIAIATTLYVIVSVSGYYLFGDEVQSDVLKNFADNRFAPLNHVARIAFTLTVIMSVPLQCFPFRKAFSSIIDILMGQLTPLTSLAKDVWATQDYKELDAEDRADALGIDLRRVGHDATRDYIEFLLLQPNQYSYTVPEQVDVKVLGAALDRYIHNIRYGELMLTYATESPAEGAMDTEDDFEVEGLCPAPSDGWVLHLSKTFFGIGTCLFLALTVPQIKEVFAVAGATSSVWLELILPAAIYIKLSLRKSNLSDVRRYGSIIDEKENDSDDDIEVATDELKDGVSRWVFILPTAMLVLGALVFVISWAGNIWRWVDGG